MPETSQAVGNQTPWNHAQIHPSYAADYRRTYPPGSYIHSANSTNGLQNNHSDDTIITALSSRSTTQRSSAPILQRNPPSAATTTTRPPRRLTRLIHDSWTPELLSWLLSSASHGAIIALLLLYDGRPAPRWPYAITLHAAIAALAALAKSTLLLPVAAALGQLKWLWFRRKRRLVDFVTFDRASRGPAGAVPLLGRTRCIHLSSIGAIITVLAMALETSFQLMVTYTERTTRTSVYPAIAVAASAQTDYTPSTTSDVILEVRWVFLSLPLGLLLVTLVFLLATIWQTSRHEARVWKNSALAVLASSVGTETAPRDLETGWNVTLPVGSESEMRRVAGGMDVVLAPGNEVGRLVVV